MAELRYDGLWSLPFALVLIGLVLLAPRSARADETIDVAASVTKVDANQQRATHGLLDADPRKSFLQLADGQLTVRDIAKLEGLDQSNELVVLSACESATEQGESAGDELVSLAVSFAMAGAPALVASLWEVADDSTSGLMATFYRALEADAGDRLDALRNAKLNLLRFKKGNATPYAAPWHWSRLKLYGDFRAPIAR